MHKGSVIWQQMLHIPPAKVLISEPLKKNQKTRATQKSLPFKKWRFRGRKKKKGQENGPKAKKDQTEIAPVKVGSN